MDPTERALRDAIIAHPDDDVPRLVYTDYLEERGGPGDLRLAENIRRHIATGQGTWCGMICQVGKAKISAGATIRRGFPESVACTFAHWRRIGPFMIREYPIVRVGVYISDFRRSWRLLLLNRFHDRFQEVDLPITGEHNIRQASQILSDALLAWARLEFVEQNRTVDSIPDHSRRFKCKFSGSLETPFTEPYRHPG